MALLIPGEPAAPLRASPFPPTLGAVQIFPIGSGFPGRGFPFSGGEARVPDMPPDGTPQIGEIRWFPAGEIAPQQPESLPCCRPEWARFSPLASLLILCGKTRVPSTRQPAGNPATCQTGRRWRRSGLKGKPPLLPESGEAGGVPGFFPIKALPGRDGCISTIPPRESILPFFLFSGRAPFSPPFPRPPGSGCPPASWQQPVSSPSFWHWPASV